MNYLIIRVQRAEDETMSEKARPAPIMELHQKCGRSKGYLDHDRVAMMLSVHGIELGSPIGLHPHKDWPLTAVTYESPNKEGYGRQNSQVMRWPARRKKI